MPTRHPLDPDPEPSTKARAVFALGLVALLTGPFVGGVVPATVALLLARQASREAYAAGGYLTGSAWIRRGARLAWAGIVLAADRAGGGDDRRPARTSPAAPGRHRLRARHGLAASSRTDELQREPALAGLRRATSG